MPTRIFINDVNKYSSRCIAEVVKQHIYYEVIIFPIDRWSFLHSFYQVVLSKEALMMRDQTQKLSTRLVHLNLLLKLWEIRPFLPTRNDNSGDFQ